MAEYGEWNHKGAVLSDVTAQKEYGVTRDLIVKGSRTAYLASRPGAPDGRSPPDQGRSPPATLSQMLAGGSGRRRPRGAFFCEGSRRSFSNRYAADALNPAFAAATAPVQRIGPHKGKTDHWPGCRNRQTQPFGRTPPLLA
jgi:hypothetical protein